MEGGSSCARRVRLVRHRVFPLVPPRCSGNRGRIASSLYCPISPNGPSSHGPGPVGDGRLRAARRARCRQAQRRLLRGGLRPLRRSEGRRTLEEARSFAEAKRPLHPLADPFDDRGRPWRFEGFVTTAVRSRLAAELHVRPVVREALQPAPNGVSRLTAGPCGTWLASLRRDARRARPRGCPTRRLEAHLVAQCSGRTPRRGPRTTGEPPTFSVPARSTSHAALAASPEKARHGRPLAAFAVRHPAQAVAHVRVRMGGREAQGLARRPARRQGHGVAVGGGEGVTCLSRRGRRSPRHCPRFQASAYGLPTMP